MPDPAEIEPTLCESLDYLAIRTWEHIVVGEAMGFRPDEPSFTDHNMITLAARHPAQVAVRKHDARWWEPRSGADFEWWLMDDTSALRLWVQAKRVDTAGACYSGLTKANAASTARSGLPARPAELQWERLRAQADHVGALPVYLFYNGRLAPNGHLGRCVALPVEIRGCTLALLDDLAPVIPQASVQDGMSYVAPLSIPWACLACHDPGPTSTPIEAARSTLHAGSDVPESETRLIASAEVPEYVAVLRDRLRGDDSARELERLPSEPDTTLLTLLSNGSG